MTIAYESGVNLFDTAEVYAGGRWVLYERQSLNEAEQTPVLYFTYWCVTVDKRLSFILIWN